MVAAEHGVWSGSQLQRLLATRAGVRLTSSTISSLLTRAPRELKLSTLEALCIALECTPNDLLVMDRRFEAEEPSTSERSGPSDQNSGYLSVIRNT